MKRVVTTVLVAVMMTAPIKVMASPSNTIIQQEKSKLNEKKELLENTQEKREEIEIEIEKLDSQIEAMLRKVDENQQNINKTEENIKEYIENVNNMENEIEHEKILLNKRMRALYINGTDSYLDFLFNSKGIMDFISRVMTMTDIIEYDKKIEAELNEKISVLMKKKQELNKEKENLLVIKDENSKKLAEIKSRKEEQDKLLAKIKREEQTYALSVNEIQNEINRIIRENTRTSSPSNTLAVGNTSNRNSIRGSRGSTGVLGNDVVAYAATFLGTPYLWGGTSPKTGFDCSGFTQYVYRHFGIEVTRTTFTQIKQGIPVSKANLQPGDLVFFGTWSNPYHMGIYVGNNKFIHSPRTGDVVKISPLTRSDFLTGRRVR